MISIAHVITRLGSSGPERALIAYAKVARELGLEQRHTVYALEAAASPIALLQARHAGLEVRRLPDAEALRRGLEDADVVVVHFWNHPVLARFLRSELPAMRLVIWSAVLGEHPPQVITPALVRLADRFVVKNPRSLALPAVAAALPAARFVLSPIDPERLAGVRRQPHDTFNVGYVGTVNFAKMHPEYVAMHAAARIPELRVIVCGGGGGERQLAEQARRLGCEERFELLGYVEGIRQMLSRLDVLGYPLCEDNYATSERSLQEAMWCGIPAVILPHGGVPALVRHGMTGLVAADIAAYPRALEALHTDRRELRRLGRNARAYAHRAFDPRRAVWALSEVLEEVRHEPKRVRRWEKEGGTSAALFVDSLGELGHAFASSLGAADPRDALAAEEAIARAPLPLAGGEGGVFQYRNHDPKDPYLRLWAGLILAANGEPERASAELAAAREFGLDDPRVREHEARVAALARMRDGGRPAAAGGEAP